MLHILYDIQYTLFAYLNMIKPILCNKLPEAISHYIPNEHYGFIHKLTVRHWHESGLEDDKVHQILVIFRVQLLIYWRLYHHETPLIVINHHY
jgi:hypothetical protein